MKETTNIIVCSFKEVTKWLQCSKLASSITQHRFFFDICFAIHGYQRESPTVIPVGRKAVLG